MIKQLLKKYGFDMTDQEFKEVMEAATQDIKFNNIGFNKKTSIKDMLVISERCCIAFRK